jgi:hypothetical protein
MIITVVIVVIVLAFAIRVTLLWRVRRHRSAASFERSYSDPG